MTSQACCGFNIRITDFYNVTFWKQMAFKRHKIIKHLTEILADTRDVSLKMRILV